MYFTWKYIHFRETYPISNGFLSDTNLFHKDHPTLEPTHSLELSVRIWVYVSPCWVEPHVDPLHRPSIWKSWFHDLSLGKAKNIWMNLY